MIPQIRDQTEIQYSLYFIAKNIISSDNQYQLMDTSGRIPDNTRYPCRWCEEPTGSSSPYCSELCRVRFLTWLKTEPSAVRGVKPPFWNVIRRLALERDGHQCQVCGSGSDLSVHHIIPLSAGGDSTLENLRVLCHPCHQKEHGHRVQIVRKKKVRIRIRYQPMYLPASFFGEWMKQRDTEVFS